MKAGFWESMIAVAGCLLAFGCGGGGGNGGGADAASVVLAPATATVTVGETVTVEVEGSNLAGIHAVAFDVLYDAERLEFVSANAGDLLGQGGVAGAFAAALENGAPGRLVVGAARLGTVPDASGSGSLARLIFRAVAPGQAGLAFGDPKTASSVENEPLPIDSWRGTTLSIE